ncbi:MAG: AMP-binding protein [Myxococcales bacterium]|nr:AMP-binding protein [Myxococcales bacterium]USN51521.1 MAG: AMP-binding protein [Myxococcales bacterium]
MFSIKGSHLNISASELEEKVKDIACRLSGVVSKNRVALYVDTSPDGIVLLLAAMKLGLEIVLCSLREPALVIDVWLKELGVHQIFYSGDGKIVEDISCFSCHISNLREFPKSNYQSKNNFSTIMRTSGSTGAPKNAVISSKAHKASAQEVSRYFKYEPTSCWLLSLPLYHVSGFSVVMRALYARASVYLLAMGESLTSSKKFWPVSHCSVVPAQVKKLLSAAVDLSNLNAVIVGGDGLNTQDQKEALKRRWPLFETYGMTESASMIWSNASSPLSGSLPHAQVLLAHDGEILVKGESLFEGYIKDGQIFSSLTSGGFFATGDIGKIDDHNRLQIIGRKNNRIISGGENIQAEEVERILEQHPSIEACVVLGISDESYGKRPMAFIKWYQNKCEQEKIAVWLEKYLARYKCPKFFFDWPCDIAFESKKPRHALALRLKLMDLE